MSNKERLVIVLKDSTSRKYVWNLGEDNGKGECFLIHQFIDFRPDQIYETQEFSFTVNGGSETSISFDGPAITPEILRQVANELESVQFKERQAYEERLKTEGK